MVVAPASIENLGASALRGSPSRFASSSDRAATRSWKRAAGRSLTRRASSAATVPACRLEHLGDPQFRAEHGCVTHVCPVPWPTASARSRSSRRWAEPACSGSSARPACPLAAVERALDRIERSLGDAIPFGMNLIHSPGEPDLEAAVVDLYLKRGVRLVEASAFLNLTLPVVRYRVAGITPRRRRADRAAESHHRQGFAGRGRLEVPGAAARGCPPRTAGDRPDHGRAGRVGGADSRWPTTSPPRPTPEGTPTTSRPSCCCRRC